MYVVSSSLLMRWPPSSTLFPYTTLFRSGPRLPPPGERERHDVDPDRGHRRHPQPARDPRSEEHTSELQSRFDLVCRLLLEKKNKNEQHPLITQLTHSSTHSTSLIHTTTL